MAKFYPELNESLRNFIEEQKIFFTATALAEGRINLSPKGRDTFRCLDNKSVAYLDLTGSGNETAAHLHSEAEPRDLHSQAEPGNEKDEPGNEKNEKEPGNEKNENNGRMTIMFCSFSEKPLILRLYGYGRVILTRHPDWSKFYSFFKPTPGERQIIVMDINSVQTSCGAGVPIYELKEERPTIIDWANKKGEQGLVEYWHEKNQTSIDGLPTKLLED